MNHHQLAFSISPRTPLHKGKACIACRRRKTKCDGVRDVCGPCSKYPTGHEDCEYSEDGPTQSQMLEEQISILQSRIEELESPQGTRTSSITLSKPVSRFPPTSQITATAKGMHLRPLLSYFHSQQTLSISTAVKTLQTELPFIVLQGLVHNFLHNATCFGFFLDLESFHDAVMSPNGHLLPPVLLNVMYLWGVHLSQDARITAYEPVFLAHALRSTANSLTGTHPRTILHSIQASVLLAHYFICNARFLEGRYHISAAVSLALSVGLHRIRTPPEDGMFSGTRSLADALPPPMSAAEEGERINALWAVLNLNNCWASAGGSASNISYSESVIDTPWPMDAHDYVQTSPLVSRKSKGTVRRFLSGLPDNATCDAVLLAKATILYAEASRMGAHYRATGVSPNSAESSSLDQILDELKLKLSPVQSKRMFVVHTLCHGATIQLHNSMTKERVASRARCLVAARAVVDILLNTDMPKIGVLDPVLAPLWTSVCMVFLTEIARQSNGNGGRAPSVLTESLDIVVAAMQFSAAHCRLMALQLDVVRRASQATVTKMEV
ncbi:hypothetical protein C8F04DRAFT_106341 [Mycena alexandri]|uniref:Zn(2)-C6 fungal-type domain-containing protein n=1 Tax=Mycena alexandri TaxID=1745969 RepID=A0AAD6SEU3_9AGAR|nr:hypothetical protein C8F04DRAFT_106341 [Mycena alexandri]